MFPVRHQQRMSRVLFYRTLVLGNRIDYIYSFVNMNSTWIDGFFVQNGGETLTRKSLIFSLFHRWQNLEKASVLAAMVTVNTTAAVTRAFIVVEALCSQLDERYNISQCMLGHVSMFCSIFCSLWASWSPLYPTLYPIRTFYFTNHRHGVRTLTLITGQFMKFQEQ